MFMKKILHKTHLTKTINLGTFRDIHIYDTYVRMSNIMVVAERQKAFLSTIPVTDECHEMEYVCCCCCCCCCRQRGTDYRTGLSTLVKDSWRYHHIPFHTIRHLNVPTDRPTKHKQLL